MHLQAAKPLFDLVEGQRPPHVIRGLHPTAAAHVTNRWQHHRGHAHQHWPTRLSTEAVHELLIDMVADSDDTTDATVAIRAFQTVAFDRNVFVSFSPEGLDVALDYIRPPHVTEQEWRRLDAWVRPWQAAACALFNAGAYPADIAAVRLDDVTTTMVLRPHGRTITLPPAALRLVRRQQAYRQQQDAAGDDLLFAEEDRPIPLRTIADVPREAAIEHGVRVTAPRTARKPATLKSQARRLGVAIHLLTGATT